MQTVEYTIETPDCPVPLFLWRAIPAQITVSGMEDISGDWIFLVDSEWGGSTLLNGTVTAEGTDLIITLDDMNTAELASAIQGKELLQCRATLTDGTSRVYLIPLTIRNRAITGVPSPAPAYYTKAQIDEIIAGLQQDAAIVDPAGTAIAPVAGTIYRHTAAAGDVFTFDTSGLGTKIADFELDLTQPATAVAVTFPAGIKWEKDGVFSAENDAPDLSTGGSTYILTFRWTGSAFLGNLAGEVR